MLVSDNGEYVVRIDQDSTSGRRLEAYNLSTAWDVSTKGSLIQGTFTDYAGSASSHSLLGIMDPSETDYGKVFYLILDDYRTFHYLLGGDPFDLTNFTGTVSGWSQRQNVITNKGTPFFAEFYDSGNKLVVYNSTYDVLELYDLVTTYSLDPGSWDRSNPDTTISNFQSTAGISGNATSISWVSSGNYCFILTSTGNVYLFDATANPYDYNELVSANQLASDTSTFATSSTEVMLKFDPTGVFGNGSYGIFTHGDNTTTVQAVTKLAFHYGDFDDAYGDGTESVAASQGRVYADTSIGTYSWGTLDSASTSNGQTTYTWTPSSNLIVTALLVAGGGGGGGRSGAGGGAGGLVYESNISISGQQTIVVGNGGSGGDNGTTSTNLGSNGYSTSFASLTTAVGGGGGGSFVNSGSGDGDDGGSGGGGGRSGNTNLGGSGVTGQGSDGGSGGSRSGGGGGAGGDGGNGTSSAGGDGGIGEDYSLQFSTIYGDSGWFAGGGGAGGGSGVLSSTAGTGGQGGGGDGSVNTPADNGLAHTGGGGGGGGYDGSNGEIGGSGGSGIVLLLLES